MGNQTGIENAKRALELLLEREWQLRGTAPSEFESQIQKKYHNTRLSSIKAIVEAYFYMRKDMPEIMAQGTSQIVFSLCDGYVGKTALNKRISTATHHMLTEQMYSSVSPHTVKVLLDLGFEVPEHHYVGVRRQGELFSVYDEGLTFAITEDLTKGGQIKVLEADGFNFNGLKNGGDLGKKFTEWTQKLKHLYDARPDGYFLSVNGHRNNQGPNLAIRRTFLLQVNPTTNTGRLVAGDVTNLELAKHY